VAGLIIEQFGVARVRLRVNKRGAIRGARDVGVMIERSRSS
jgi:dihydroneopterin aldolase